MRTIQYVLHVSDNIINTMILPLGSKYISAKSSVSTVCDMSADTWVQVLVKFSNFYQYHVSHSRRSCSAETCRGEDKIVFEPDLIYFVHSVGFLID
jgi:hypothetical protein